MGDYNKSFWGPEQNKIEKLRKQSTPNIYLYQQDLFKLRAKGGFRYPIRQSSLVSTIGIGQCNDAIVFFFTIRIHINIFYGLSNMRSVSKVGIHITPK